MTVPLNGPQPRSPLSPDGGHSAMIKLKAMASAVVLSSGLHTGLLGFAAFCLWHLSLKFYLGETMKNVLSFS